jgi:hypothetical protein
MGNEGERRLEATKKSNTMTDRERRRLEQAQHQHQQQQQQQHREQCDNKGEVVCWNGGHCKRADYASQDEPCACPDGWTGPHCQEEFTGPCTLQCQNGSVCKTGKNPATYGGEKGGMYCACPEGFAGLHCEFTAEVCGDENADELVCLNGSKCVGEKGNYSCECETGYKEESSRYNDDGTQIFCQHHHVDMCHPVLGMEFANSMAVPAFCVNDGKCVDVLVETKVYPACECPPLYKGPHCEFYKTIDEIEAGVSSKPATDTAPYDDSRRPALIAFLIIIMSGLLLLTGYLLQRRYRRTRKKQRKGDGTSVNLQEFRQEDFAVSPNGSMLFPAYTAEMHGEFEEVRIV